MKDQKPIDMSTVKKTPKRKAHKITPSKFDIARFTLPREIRETTQFDKSKKKIESKQYTLFPKYKYTQSTGENNSKVDADEDSLYIMTDPIEFRRGGLLEINDEFRPTDDDCCAFWIPLEKESGGDGAEALHNLLLSIDKSIGGKIKKSPDNYLTIKQGAQEKPLKKLST